MCLLNGVDKETTAAAKRLRATASVAKGPINFAVRDISRAHRRPEPYWKTPRRSIRLEIILDIISNYIIRMHPFRRARLG